MSPRTWLINLADHAGFALRLAQFALAGGDGEHVAEFHLLLIAAEFLHPDDVSGRDAILLSPGADDRVHNASTIFELTNHGDEFGDRANSTILQFGNS